MSYHEYYQDYFQTILQINRITIHDIINNQETKLNLKQFWKIKQYMIRKSIERDKKLDDKFLRISNQAKTDNEYFRVNHPIGLLKRARKLVEDFLGRPIN